ncbi:GtrA family protein [Mesorhizobium sp. BAC0120]|uniref:GtrA family protein n=1 Tax=Mesorhizobium sp. BAC0120 TaxID=3090670 RepID=UPI00298C484A|nr:GtrA family protein [Mesorhizobium sp. BAC0120]MDW6024569.1 GtrA family protein [Mesorhizobium sp. BAC0120]
MTALDTATPERLEPWEPWRADFVPAAIVALIMLGLYAVQGFSTLSDSHGDNDSLLRLVEVRDLIAGQGWYDLHQYRMGPAGGFVMHWSRIVDTPIAAIILAASALTGSMARGETVALVLWPTILLVLAMTFIVRIARALGGEWSLLPALFVGGGTLYYIGVFAPADIDHHNVQLVLTLAALSALVAGRGSGSEGFASGLAAGVASALMLAVGMETLPYVAVAGLAAAIGFLVRGDEEAHRACGFGLGLAGLGIVAFIGTVPPDAWLAPQCDAYSTPQFTVALIAGVGLAIASGIRSLGKTLLSRFVSLCFLGIAVGAITVVFFPQCVAAPYAGVDPKFQKFWLDAIEEAQPFWKLAMKDPAMAMGYYVTPLIGLVILALRVWRRGAARTEIIVAAFLGAALAVSLWQVRGAVFALPLAVIPLVAWIGSWRERVAASVRRATFKMVLAWLISIPFIWHVSAAALVGAFGGPGSSKAASAASCDTPGDFAALAAMPATTVLAISNLGAPILVHTHHRVLAGPYHRNVHGDLIAFEALSGTEDEARKIIRDNDVGLVAICRGNGETAAFQHWAPAGLLATLVGGSTPAWLEKLSGPTGQALEIYRVR